MNTIVSINGAINGVVWGPPMMILLIGVGILMTVSTPDFFEEENHPEGDDFSRSA